MYMRQLMLQRQIRGLETKTSECLKLLRQLAVSWVKSQQTVPHLQAIISIRCLTLASANGSAFETLSDAI